MRRFSLLVALVISLLLPAAAWAQNGDAATPSVSGGVANASQFDWSITISPIHIILPVVELTGEHRFFDELGVALILGGGQIEVTDILGTAHSFTIFEAGASGRYYVIGNFEHGMQVGGELTYAYVDTDSGQYQSVSGEGLAVGAFIGYKVAMDIGFTFDSQLGGQYVTAKASDSESSASASDDEFGLLLNLNIGWSF